MRKSGCCPPAKRTASGYREYDNRDLERLEFIRNAQAFGFSLGEIKEILASRDHGVAPCPYVLTLINRKIQEIRMHIRELHRTMEQLKQIQKAAAKISQEEFAARGRFCHILENRRLRKT